MVCKRLRSKRESSSFETLDALFDDVELIEIVAHCRGTCSCEVSSPVRPDDVPWQSKYVLETMISEQYRTFESVADACGCHKGTIQNWTEDLDVDAYHQSRFRDETAKMLLRMDADVPEQFK